MAMKNILVPCDFSPPAVQAFKFAADIASASVGEVCVLKVIDFPCQYSRQLSQRDPRTIFNLEEEYKQQYEKLKSIYAQITVPISFSLEQGGISTTVLKVIDEKGIDLVVMGVKGGAVNESIGTIAARVIRSSPVPVIVLKTAVHLSCIRSILFALPQEIYQAKFVAYVKALQDFFHATLHILFVNTPLNFQVDSKTRADVEDFVQRFNISNYTFAIRNDNQVQEGIIQYAAEISTDLIVLGTHGRKGVSHLLYGSVTEDVVHNANCPVWTYILKQD